MTIDSQFGQNMQNNFNIIFCSNDEVFCTALLASI